MPKRYVLRCERNWVLESESDKEEDWLVVAALGDVLEKVTVLTQTINDRANITIVIKCWLLIGRFAFWPLADCKYQGNEYLWWIPWKLEHIAFHFFFYQCIRCLLLIKLNCACLIEKEALWLMLANTKECWNCNIYTLLSLSVACRCVRTCAKYLPM